MAKPEWGSKYTCRECGGKFYDMRRPEIVCPKCGAAYQTAAPKPKRALPEAKEPVVQKTPAVVPEVAAGASAADIDGKDVGDPEDADKEVEDEDVEDDDKDVIQDTSDLGNDDDDMAEVIQKPAPPEEV